MRNFLVAGLMVGMIFSGFVGSAGAEASVPSCDLFSVGDRVEVYKSLSINVRSAAGTTSSVLGSQTSGAIGKVVAGPVTMSGFCWFNVNFDSGVDGWAAGSNLKTSATTNVVPNTNTPTTVACQNFSIGDKVFARRDLNVRRTPSIFGTVLFSLRGGDSGKIIAGPERKDGYCWWNIDFNNTPDGWVADANITLLSNDSTQTTNVVDQSTFTNINQCIKFAVGDPFRTLDAVRFRAAPNIPVNPFTQNNIIQTVPKGMRGWVESGPSFGQSYCWWKFKTVTGLAGWAVGNYFEKVTEPTVIEGGPRGTVTVVAPVLGEEWNSSKARTVRWTNPTLPVGFVLDEIILTIMNGDAEIKRVVISPFLNSYVWDDFSGLAVGNYRVRVTYHQRANYDLGEGDRLSGLSVWGESGVFKFSNTTIVNPPVDGVACGDVNKSGAVDLTDAGAIINYIFQGTAMPAGIKKSDVDGSGGVTISDAVYISNFLAGTGARPWCGEGEKPVVPPIITTTNLAPTLEVVWGGSENFNTSALSVSIVEGSYGYYRFRAQDPEHKPISCAVNWGDGNIESCTTYDMNSGGGVASGLHTYKVAGTYSFLVTVTDDRGAKATRSLEVVVRKQTINPPANTTGTPPIIPPVIPPTQNGTFKVEAVNPEFTVNVNLPNSAAEITIPHTNRIGFRYNVVSGVFPVQYSYDWGDGLVKTGSILASYPSIGDFHSYTKSGVFNVLIKLTDASGATFSKSVRVLANGDWARTAPCGDINGDLVVNETDATLIKDYVMGSYVPPQSVWKLDVDGTGMVTLSDSIYLINYFKIGGPVPKCLRPTNLIADESLNSPTKVIVGRSNTWNLAHMASAVKPVTFTINWGDGTANSSVVSIDGTARVLAHTFANTGKFTLTLTAVDSIGVGATKTLVVEVVADSTALLPVRPAMIGDRVKVNTAPYNYSLAVFGTKFGGEYIKSKPVGSLGTTIDGPYLSSVTKLTTWKVRWDDGLEGWSYDGGLEKIQ
ncbi:MAG: dockerin type I domain-containing protein [Candidatus Shapirobacteria bacterium]